MIKKRLINLSLRKQHAKSTISPSHNKTLYVLLASILLICLTSLALSNALTDYLENLPSPEPTATNYQENCTQTQSQFNVDVIYAYAGPEISNKPVHDFNGIPMHHESLYPDIVYLNFTHVSNAEKEACEAEIEVYQIQLTADTGIQESHICFFGTNYATNFPVISNATSRIEALMGTQHYEDISGVFKLSMSTNESLWFKVGSLDSTTSKPSGLGLWKAGEPKLIIISVQRIGSIALDGMVSSIRQAKTEEAVTVSLENSGQGFIYNIIPKDKMLQTDVFHPIDLEKPLT